MSHTSKKRVSIVDSKKLEKPGYVVLILLSTVSVVCTFFLMAGFDTGTSFETFYM